MSSAQETATGSKIGSKAKNHKDGSALMLVIGLVPLFLGSLIVPLELSKYFARHQAEVDPTGSQVAPSAPVDTVIPTPVANPVDLSALLPSFGIILLGLIGVATVGLLITLTVSALKRTKRERLAAQRLSDEQREDQRQALAIWQRSVDSHRSLRDQALRAETDWELLFSYPSLVDSSVPSTREFHRALQAADSTSSGAPAGLNLSMDIGALPYPKLVAEAEEAWSAAWSFAQRTGTRLIPRNERKKIDQIKKLLKLAESSGSSPYEREVAYSRVEKLIRELRFVRVPERALQAIGAQQRPMIEGAGTTPATQVAEPILVGVAPHRLREKV